MTRSEIIARIADRIHFIVGAAPNVLASDKPLIGQRVDSAVIDSLDIAELENALEDEFDLPIGALDAVPVDWSIDNIADAVIAAKGIL